MNNDKKLSIAVGATLAAFSTAGAHASTLTVTNDLTPKYTVAAADDSKAKSKEDAEDGCGGDMGCGANMKKKNSKSATKSDTSDSQKAPKASPKSDTE